jgi:hypothetical protein
MTRLYELRFAVDELLHRHAGHADFRASGGLKPGSLRIQISVNRGSKLERGCAEVPSADPKRSGCAAISVGEARACASGGVRVDCIDDPARDSPAHALIALSTERGPSDYSPEQMKLDVDMARGRLGASFRPCR